MGGSSMNYEVAADGLAEEQVSRLETVLLGEYEVTVLDNEDAVSYLRVMQYGLFIRIKRKTVGGGYGDGRLSARDRRCRQRKNQAVGQPLCLPCEGVWSS